MARKLLSLIVVLLLSASVTAIGDEDEYAILFGDPIAAPPAPPPSPISSTAPEPTTTDVPESTSTSTPSPHQAQQEDESTMEDLSNTPRFKTKLNDYASTLRSSGNSDIYKGSGGSSGGGSSSAGSGNLLKEDMLDNMKEGSGDTSSSGYSSPYFTPRKASSGGYGSSGSAGSAGRNNYGLGGNSAYAGAGFAGTGNYKASSSTESGAGGSTGLDLD